MNLCTLYKNKDFELVKEKVRDLPELKILRCTSCAYVFLEGFDHIDDKFYNNSKMREYDANKEWYIQNNKNLNPRYEIVLANLSMADAIIASVII